MSILQYPSANLILYESEGISITVLGGIELYHLDRMRVTLKIEIPQREHPEYLEHPDIANLALRQSVDLYNDHQTEKLARKVSEKLEVAGLTIIKALAGLTDALEAYRQEELQKQHQDSKQQEIVLTAAEQQQAENFLSQPNLMQRTNDAIERSGVIGEALNRMILFIVFTSRKRSQPLHAISLGSSGAGKSHLQESIAAFIPDEDKIEITSLSSNALYYFEQHALKHKLLLIEDLDGAEQALFPIRELQSKKKITKTISYKDSKGNTRTMQLIVEGPVCVAGCTTKAQVYEDNANRSFLLQLDESKMQDEAIMEYQRKKSAGTIDTTTELQTRKLLQNCQRILQPVTVKNPFAEKLKIPAEVFKGRRTNRHYLDFIEAVTFYHLYQRRQQVEEDTGEVYIETTIEDIQEANKLMKEVLLRKSDVLSGAARNYFEQLKNYLQTAKEPTFTNRDIQLQLRIAHSTVKRHHKELLEAGFITVHAVQNRSYQYSISEDNYTVLQDHVSNTLDNVLQSIAASNTKPNSKHKKKLNSLHQPNE